MHIKCGAIIIDFIEKNLITLLAHIELLASRLRVARGSCIIDHARQERVHLAGMYVKQNGHSEHRVSPLERLMPPWQKTPRLIHHLACLRLWGLCAKLREKRDSL